MTNREVGMEMQTFAGSPAGRSRASESVNPGSGRRGTRDRAAAGWRARTATRLEEGA